MMDFDADMLKELQAEFLKEAKDLLAESEEALLRIQPGRDNAEDIALIFRLVHSVKGAAASVGLEDIGGFCHKFEDCISLLRIDASILTDAMVMLFLKAVDTVKTRLEHLTNNAMDTAWDTKALEADLTEIAEQRDAGAPKSDPQGGERAAAVPETTTTDPVVTGVATPTAPKTEDTSIPPAVATAVTAPATPASVPVPEAQAVEAASGSQTKQPEKASSTIKMDTEKLDTLLDLVGELVVLKTQLMHSESLQQAGDNRLLSIISEFDKVVRELQTRSLSMRLTNLKPLFLKVKRGLKDLSIQLKKDVQIDLSGGDIEIDRNMIELLSDPLMHIARNALDHGIDTAEERLAKGKNLAGHIEIKAYQRGTRVIVEIKDDGRGINKEKVLKKAIEKGFFPQGSTTDSIPEANIYRLLFMPGFSTAEKITNVSGRGVGLDVVQDNLNKMKGAIEIHSVFGEGTSFKISIPVMSAITDGLLVMISGERYIVPIDVMKELIESRDASHNRVAAGESVLKVRNRLYELVRIKERLAENGRGVLTAQSKNTVYVLAENDDKEVAFEVDEVLGQIQVVRKTLGDFFVGQEMFSGGAILHDGRVALILNLEHFVATQAQKAA